jgi:hypothetical protein
MIFTKWLIILIFLFSFMVIWRIYSGRPKRLSKSTGWKCTAGGGFRSLVGNHYAVEAFVIYHNITAISESEDWNCSSSSVHVKLVSLRTLATFARWFNNEHYNALRGWKPQLPLPAESSEPWLAKNHGVLSQDSKVRWTELEYFLNNLCIW